MRTPKLKTWPISLLLATSGTIALANGMHPEVPILDAMANPVIETGAPMSTMTTCGGDCHDTTYITANSDHADAGASSIGAETTMHGWQSGNGYFGGWDPVAYDTDGLAEDGLVDPEAWLERFGSRHVGGGPVATYLDMDCLLCHMQAGDQARRGELLANGDFAWANSVHMEALGALERFNGVWRWNPAQFQENGALRDGLLTLRKPDDENCGQCHGQVGTSLEDPLTIAADPGQRHNSERTGQIISPQKLLNSGLNISGKEALNFAFDVHSDRVVGCVNCHYSLNNPVYFQQRFESRPEHLEFDPRRLTNAGYLERPLHQFAKGRSTLGLAAMETENTLRRCESCHQAKTVHEWLPFKQRHFTALACESCHVPRLFGPGLQSVDWTMVDAAGEPRREYRNLSGDPVAVDTLINGFEPVLMPREDASGDWKLAPHNLVTTWYWVAGEPAFPLTRAQLREALLQGDGHHPDLLAALDNDRDGRLSGAELLLAGEERLAAVRTRLQQAGYEAVDLRGETIPFPVSHGVVNGQWATRECRQCHGEGSDLDRAFILSANRPGTALPVVPDYPGVLVTGAIRAAEDGSVEFRPDVAAEGFYILGLHSQSWADQLGLLMFLTVFAGVSAHAAARWYFSRRRAKTTRKYQRVYMYDAYERLWHWMQASAILLLLFTGLVIHKPSLFGVFSFPWIVRVHNVLGFILLINAALSLFYHLASGQIRQYLPEPHGFIGRSISQALYYSRGVFAGHSHPLEKTRDRKLNPLQQVTYLVILNVLLPAQIVSGILIWGLQKWPDIAASVGGLPALALVHSLVAWTFAAFILMHVYLTTVGGHTPGAGIKAMVEGWDWVEDHAATPAGDSADGAGQNIDQDPNGLQPTGSKGDPS